MSDRRTAVSLGFEKHGPSTVAESTLDYCDDLWQVARRIKISNSDQSLNGGESVVFTDGKKPLSRLCSGCVSDRRHDRTVSTSLRGVWRRRSSTFTPHLNQLEPFFQEVRHRDSMSNGEALELPLEIIAYFEIERLAIRVSHVANFIFVCLSQS
ncbi:hypothetical protein [Agrobacterium vitis]|uniref:hypothetical protein n=1 Tax=Agrobacterium vitis TaxID=373 RepID=UPI0020360047|nr:hypothetical protein [Agrobacterium vitis]